MIIQSKRVWLLNEFKAAQIEIENNQIKNVISHENNIVNCIINFFEHYALQYEFEPQDNVFFIDLS